MITTADQLAEAALALPREERAVLAAILADSLEEKEDPTEVAGAWDAEIQRRLAAIERGEARFLSDEEVKQRLEAKYGPLLD